MNEPAFVQRSAGQSADSAEGVIVALIVGPDGQPNVALIDGATMKEVAVLSLPIAPLQENTGAHNYWAP